jgi:predicted  nucleic acid-binding Zn ribbon protein
MEAQGYHVQDNILFQDNKSAILLEKNGKALSSKHTKHINIRFFYYQQSQNGRYVIGLVPNWRHDWQFYDKTFTGGSVSEIQRPNYGSDPGTGSWARKAQASKWRIGYY